MDNKKRLAIARALGEPDKSLTLEQAKQYELVEENGEIVARLKGEKND